MRALALSGLVSALLIVNLLAGLAALVVAVGFGGGWNIAGRRA